MFNIYTKNNEIAIQATQENLFTIINGLLQAGEVITEIIDITL